MISENLDRDVTLAITSPRKYFVLKRVLDFVFCLIIMPAFMVILIFIALAIFLDTGGPILFCQERVGRDGRRFRMYKFRTLVRNYDPACSRSYMQAFVRGGVGNEEGKSSTRIHKPIDRIHITRVGRILRKTSLDELPQILNILRGDMSLVGPRPNVLDEVAAYRDWHRERLRALPGITGLAQVRGRSCLSFDDIVRADLEYIEKQSLKLDLLIIWWTVLSVLDGQGAG